jgi:HEAT repeat protein
LVEKGDSVNGEEEIIAAPAELESEDNIECEHSYSIDQYLSDIESGSFEEKFAAVKALGFCDYDNNAESVLREVVDDQSENYFLRLEAAGSLARHGVDKGYEFLKGNARLSSTVSDPEEDASKRLEALLILREVGGQEAGKVLAENLRNEDELVELRAQAAACIGEINQPEFAEALLSAFEYRHKKIKDDAIEALAKLDKTGVETALEGLSSNSEDKQIGSAIALAVMDGVSIEDIIAHVEDNEVSEKWLSFAFGLREMDEVAENMESTEALDQDVAFGSEVVSSIFNSWADPLSQVIRIKLRRDLEGNNDNGQRDLSEF